jgi:hypothetical protein
LVYVDARNRRADSLPNYQIYKTKDATKGAAEAEFIETETQMEKLRGR